MRDMSIDERIKGAVTPGVVCNKVEQHDTEETVRSVAVRCNYLARTHERAVCSEGGVQVHVEARGTGMEQHEAFGQVLGGQ